MNLIRRTFWVPLWGWMLVALPASLPALEILFLGDQGHHQPALRFRELQPALRARGIQLTYTEERSALNPQTLRAYQGLMVYANIDEIEASQADAILQYVEQGGAFLPLHCATYCFRNDERIVALMGAQFKRHEAETFSTVIAEPTHPLMQGFHGFTSWDETYIHHKHNSANRIVLEFREQGPHDATDRREPWTWIRTHGRGRVFYTAWGHDARTWTHPGFHNLIERGIRWACQDTSAVPEYRDEQRFDIPKMTPVQQNAPPFDFIDVGAKIPNYPVSERWGTQAEPLTQMQKPLPAADSMKHMVTPVGFHVDLFATEPHLGAKPIAMNWDERGRLWVCETLDYPNELQPNNQGRDRIQICEDTDGDGRADRFTTFAEGLSIPTAILVSGSSAIVQNGNETLWLRDTNGDDVADVRKPLISGWNMTDTHGGVSHFRYGLDNWIYAMQGYNDSHPVLEPGKQAQAGFRMGFWRFRLSPSTTDPVVEELEFLRSTNNNTWGLGITEEGLLFGSTANHNPSNFLAIPNRYYERVRGWSAGQLTGIADTYLFRAVTSRIRQVDQHGGYTAGAGHAIYTSRAYPRTWWNRTAFVCEPTGKLVGTFVLYPEGANFRSTSPCNLLASQDEWTAPIAAEVGPDGNVWVLDWYNYIVQHNPTPQGFKNGPGNAYESDLRDKQFGRVYRVVSDQTEPSYASRLQAPILRSDDVTGCLAALSHPTMLVRSHAQRLLVQRAKTDIVPDLCRKVRDTQCDEIGLNVGAIHALHTLAGLHALEQPSSPAIEAVWEALQHPSAGVRRNAILVLPKTAEMMSRLAQHSIGLDPVPQVRLAWLLTLADAPQQATIASRLVTCLSDASLIQDPVLRDGLTSAAAVHAQAVLPQIPTALTKDISPAQLELIRLLSQHQSRGRVEASELTQVLDACERSVAVAASLPPEAAQPRLAVIQAMMSGIAEGWPSDHKITLPSEAAAQLIRFIDRLPATSQSELIRLASFWNTPALAEHAQRIGSQLLATVQDTHLAAPNRLAAATLLVQIQTQSDEVVRALLQQIGPQTDPDFAQSLLEIISTSRCEQLASLLLAEENQITPSLRRTIVRGLLGRVDTVRALLRAIETRQISADDLALDQKTALTNHPDADVRRLAQRVFAAQGGLPDPDRQKVLDTLLPLCSETGDATLGKEVFKQNCAKCHRHGDMGENIGPNLTGMAVHPKAELLTHIVDPSRSVEGNFRSYSLVLQDGRVLTGMLAGESKTAIELIDTEGKRHPLQRSDIEEFVPSKKSVMPEGFEKSLQRKDWIHLLEFLTLKGRFVPLDLRKVATIASDQGMFYDAAATQERLVFPDWGTKTFRQVPFLLIDPQGGRVANVVMMHGPQGTFPPRMPESVLVPVHSSAVKLHLLSGISGWGYPAHGEKTVSLTLRIRYDDDQTEDHPLKNGVHFADYIRRVDVEQSEFAFDLGGRQIRYLSVIPRRPTVPIRELELVKEDDPTAPIVMAITVERGEGKSPESP